MVIVSGRCKEEVMGRFKLDPAVSLESRRLRCLLNQEKKTERVCIDLNLKALNESWIDQLESAIKSSKGKIGITIDVYDGKNKIVMPSRNSQVEVSNAFLNKLEEICQPGVANYRFEINRG